MRRHSVSVIGTIVALAATGLAAGCSTARYAGDENSPFYEVPVGSRVTLTRELVIEPEQVAVFLQNGRALPWPQINPQYPHCKFEVRERRSDAQTVKPDEFAVTRVVREVTHTVDSGRLQLAGVGLALRVGGVDGDGASVRAFATYLYLRSERQPQVFRLGCGHWDYPGKSSAEHLSINAMRKALGEVVTLSIAAPASS
jgi:hypothetical protein